MHMRICQVNANFQSTEKALWSPWTWQTLNRDKDGEGAGAELSNSYQTRFSEHNFTIPDCQGPKSHTFYYSAIKDWNNLPEKTENHTRQQEV